MRHISVVGTGILLSATLFASCTCHKEVSQPPEPVAFNTRPIGFPVTPRVQEKVAQAKPTPPAQAPTAQVAALPSPPADVPKDFPPDVPIFKDAALAQVQNLANNAHNVVFTTAAPVAEVFTFYQERMKKAGWVATQQFQRPQHAFVTFKKGNMLANLTIAEDVRNPGQQVIAIMYEQQKEPDFDEF